jgi:peptidoglycan/LPS O-acetylase OafA/YrhL
MEEPNNPIRRFVYLDSARGLAAMSVIIWHFIAGFSILMNNSFFLNSPLHFFWYGEADVIFFFVHSGFILTYAYAGWKSKITVGNYARFLIERVFRIYPLFIFVLLLSYALQEKVYPLQTAHVVTEQFHSFWKGHIDLHKLLKNAALIFSVNQESFGLIPQDWTLAIEVIVGPFVPFLAFILRGKKLFWLYWVIIFIAIFILKINTYLFEFGLGIFIFYNWQRINNIWKSINLSIRLLILVAAVSLYTCFFHFCSMFNTSNVWIRPGIDRFFVAIGCGLFFCIIISSRGAQKIMSHPLLVKIGKACYSLYLWHMIFLICVANLFMPWLHQVVAISPVWALVIYFILYMIANLLLSQLTYRLIEIPFNMLGKRIGRRVESIMSPVGMIGKKTG